MALTTEGQAALNSNPTDCRLPNVLRHDRALELGCLNTTGRIWPSNLPVKLRQTGVRVALRTRRYPLAVLALWVQGSQRACREKVSRRGRAGAVGVERATEHRRDRGFIGARSFAASGRATGRLSGSWRYRGGFCCTRRRLSRGGVGRSRRGHGRLSARTGRSCRRPAGSSASGDTTSRDWPSPHG